MNVYKSLAEIPPAADGRSVALGTFDGVHRGHRSVIATAVDRAREHGLLATVVTFDPHPLQVLRPDDPPRLLTTLAVKAALVAELGVDEMLAIPFTPELARRSAEDFVAEVLLGALGVRQLSVGANFRFGHEARGDAALLRELPEFETTVVPLVEHGQGPISSSRIRELVASGDVRAAGELLGAPFRLEGEVVEGDARGRALDMPTANLAPPLGVVLPAPGIYAAAAHAQGLVDEVPAAVSIGVRPTFEDRGDLRVEAHLIGFDGDLYGKDVTLEFLERLRDEVKFDSAEELQVQMRKDVAQTREVAARDRVRR
jgi:riboflavin kinase/FMN adenylyltransferase